MSRIMKFVLMVALLVSVVAAGLVYADRGEGRGRGFGAKLTGEQREAVQAKVREMHEAGTSREEIHAVVREMMEGYGITPPEGRPEGPREGRGPGRHFGDRLTEEQREAVHAKVREMHEAGASREEIHAAVREMLTGFGIDVPNCPGGRAASPQTGSIMESPGQGMKWGEIKGEFE
jgi:DNA-binding transcriptional regulator YhcF (GntR family)